MCSKNSLFKHLKPIKSIKIIQNSLIEYVLGEDIIKDILICYFFNANNEKKLHELSKL